MEKILKMLNSFWNIVNSLLGKNAKKDEVVSSTENNIPIEETKSKIFGKNSLYDALKRVRTSISLIEKFAPEKYADYDEKLKEIEKKIKSFYEEKECSGKYVMKIHSDLGAVALDLERSLYTLKQDIEVYKEKEFNFIYLQKKVAECNENLSLMYKQLILKMYKEITYRKSFITEEDRKMVKDAYFGIKDVMDEIEKTALADIIEKIEEIANGVCECIYTFFKSNALCGVTVEKTFEMEYKKEESLFVEIFLKNVKELIAKVKDFEKNPDFVKYYNEHMPTLRGIVERAEMPEGLLLNNEFLLEFVKIEVDIIVKHAHLKMVKKQNIHTDNEPSSDDVTVANEKEGIDFINNEKVEIPELKNYIKVLREEYKEENKLYFFEKLVSNFKYPLTTYELYMLLYFFKLKTFFVTYIKKCDENDPMRRVLEKHKSEKVNLSKCNPNENNIYYKFFTICDREDVLDGVKSSLKHLGICYKEEKVSNLVRFYFAIPSSFEDCINILMNLKEFETLKE